MSIVPISTRCTTAITLRCLLPILFALPITAQEPESPVRVMLDEPITVTLSGAGASYFTYDADAGEVVTVTVRTRHELEDNEEAYVRDTVVEVLNPTGERIAYNDDHDTERDDLLTTDSVVENLVLPEAGAYTIRANTYGGVFATAVEVMVTAGDLFNAIIDMEENTLVIMATLPEQTAYHYNFNATEGDVLTITARDLSGGFDPVLYLLNAAGEHIAINDDHDTDDLLLDVLDAKLSALTIPATGDYTLRVADFLGRAGQVEITISAGFLQSPR